GPLGQCRQERTIEPEQHLLPLLGRLNALLILKVVDKDEVRPGVVVAHAAQAGTSPGGLNANPRSEHELGISPSRALHAAEQLGDRLVGYQLVADGNQALDCSGVAGAYYDPVLELLKQGPKGDGLLGDRGLGRVAEALDDHLRVIGMVEVLNLVMKRRGLDRMPTLEDDLMRQPPVVVELRHV